MSVAETIREIISEEASVGIDAVRDDALLKHEIGVASIEMILIVSDIEEEFGIEVPDDVQDNFKTPKDIIDYVEANVKK
jgi:acyl carrier protein